MTEPQQENTSKESSGLSFTTITYGVMLGVGIGVALGSSMDNMATGISFGIAIGIAFALIFYGGKPKAKGETANPETGKTDPDTSWSE